MLRESAYSMRPVTSSSRFETLDWVRGLAALWVLCFHYSFSPQFVASFPALHRFFKNGDLGVPVFFVVLGFCIAAAVVRASQRQQGVWQFTKRRIVRIYPTFWCSIVLTMALPFLLEGLSYLKTSQFVFPDPTVTSNGWLNYSWQDWLGIWTLGRVFADVPDATSLQAKFNSINAVYWTLAIEVQFYLVAGLAVAKRVAIVPLVLAVTAISLFLTVYSPSDVSGIYFPFGPMFVFGMALYGVGYKGWYAERYVPLWGRVAGLLFLPAVAMFLNEYVVPFSAVVAIWLWVLWSFDELLGDLQMKKSLMARLLVLGFTLFGCMSYSLYLIHGRVQHLGKQIVRQVLSPHTITYDIAVLTFVLVVSAGFYFVAERPFVLLNTRRGVGRTNTRA